jgi:putative DNA primase/helicase
MHEHREFSDAVKADLGPLASLPESIEPGRLHRFSTNGKRSDLSGWCRLFEDGRAGVYGCWRFLVTA